mgnify:CR=1 FL=1
MFIKCVCSLVRSTLSPITIYHILYQLSFVLFNFINIISIGNKTNFSMLFEAFLCCVFCRWAGCFDYDTAIFSRQGNPHSLDWVLDRSGGPNCVYFWINAWWLAGIMVQVCLILMLLIEVCVWLFVYLNQYILLCLKYTGLIILKTSLRY